jgi:hypothetical protein
LMTFCPPLVLMRTRNPWSFFLFLLFGRNVGFMIFSPLRVVCYKTSDILSSRIYLTVVQFRGRCFDMYHRGRGKRVTPPDTLGGKTLLGVSLQRELRSLPPFPGAFRERIFAAKLLIKMGPPVGGRTRSPRHPFGDMIPF